MKKSASVKGKSILSTDKKMIGIYNKTVEGNSPKKKQPRVEVVQEFMNPKAKAKKKK
jgi:putative ubiquitin-RnfH superfamily antitoxin RatB of RatAB toxin-antitoxin module